MHSDQDNSGTDPELDVTGYQLQSDIAHLRSIWRGLTKTSDLIERARRAYQDSIELLKQDMEGRGPRARSS